MKTLRFTFLVISAILLLILTYKRERSSNLNLDFEQIDFKTKNPINWYFGESPFYKYSIDSSVVYHGKYSIKLERVGDGGSQNDNIAGFRIIDNIKPINRIRLTAFIKTESTNLDSLGICIGYNNFEGDTTKLLRDINLIGTNDWKEFSVNLPVKRNVDYYIIGVCLFGKGKIWIDNLKLYVDDVQLKKLPSSPAFKATTRELTWLKNKSIPIKTVQSGSGFEDMEPLKEKFRDAKIIGLGENTHGSSEVFKMKHRLVEFLATEMGFTIFSIEANMPEAYKLNDYVLNGTGDPKTLLKGMYFWTWNTQEVLDMIEWMREFNVRGKDKIQFTGFDMQMITGALDNLYDYAKKHDRILKTNIDTISVRVYNLKSKGARIFESTSEIESIKHKCSEVLTYLTENKSSIIHVINEKEYKWLVQNAGIMVQSSDVSNLTGSAFRDECMAKNIDWILGNNPDAKIVLWAHNYHISKQKGSMGYYLSKKYGNKYFNVGFLSNSGTYTGVNSGRVVSTNKLVEGVPGSFEYSFHKIGTPNFFFDFDQVHDQVPESNWLSSRLNFRDIGAVAKENQFIPARISKMFNSIIYIDSTHASQCFSIY
jgi:erythromycin esterase